MKEVRKKLMKKAKRIRERSDRTYEKAYEMRDLLEAILNAYNYEEKQPLWDEIVVLLSEIDGVKPWSKD